MASTSRAKESPVPLKEPMMNHLQCPAPLASYRDVAANPKIFMATLEKLHASMGTKFMIPVIGGKELDLHRLFVEVTSRGGIEKIVREKRWKEVTAIFNFPSTATNASFVLRKYYGSLLYRYEQLYYLKAQGGTPVPTASLPSPLIAHVPAQVHVQTSPEYQAATAQKQQTNSIELGGASPASSPVIGVIDGKCETGYLVTVTIGSEKLRGVLYEAPHKQSFQLPQHSAVSGNNVSGNACSPLGTQRRRRRKKSEIKRRDPAHPKPNRSGYNFFFAEQHARLKPLHPGKDRAISSMIGELWNKLKESDKSVYQEKAVKDKERYRKEMEDYRQRLRSGRVISNAVPLQQRLPEEEVNMMETDMKTDETGGDSPHSPDDESVPGESDSEDDKIIAEKDANPAADSVVGLSSDSGKVATETAEPAVFELSKGDDNIGETRFQQVGNVAGEES